MDITRFSVDTHDRRIVDITNRLRAFARSHGGDGLLAVFLPHATAGLAVIEIGSGTEADLEAAVDRLLPRAGEYAHAHGREGHGADHVLPAFIGPSLTLIVEAGDIVLGRWQSVVVVDPNRSNDTREVRVSLVRGVV